MFKQPIAIIPVGFPAMVELVERANGEEVERFCACNSNDATSLLDLNVAIYDDTEPFEVHISFPTEEGFTSEHVRYYVEDGKVYAETNTNARDCDGRFSTHQLMVWEGENWSHVESDQRDYTAESMGY